MADPHRDPARFPPPTPEELAISTRPAVLFKPAGVDGVGLPKGVLERLQSLQDRASSLQRLLPASEERTELGVARIEATQRLKRLTDHVHAGGFALGPADARVVAQQAVVDKLTRDIDRMNAKYEKASALWEPAARAVAACELWLKSMRPGTALEDFATEPPKLNGKETALDAIERLRRRCRELRADLRRVESAPFPSSFAKQRMREQIEALAARGTPTISLLVEFADREVVWPQVNLRARVFNTEIPSFAATEVPDTLALFAWLHQDALIARLDDLITEESDDGAALSMEARQLQAAEISGDLLDVERMESTLVHLAQAQGLPAEHRDDCSAQAVLGCQLITVPQVLPSGSSPGRGAIEIVGPR